MPGLDTWPADDDGQARLCAASSLFSSSPPTATMPRSMVPSIADDTRHHRYCWAGPGTAFFSFHLPKIISSAPMSFRVMIIFDRSLCVFHFLSPHRTASHRCVVTRSALFKFFILQSATRWFTTQISAAAAGAGAKLRNKMSRKRQAGPSTDSHQSYSSIN